MKILINIPEDIYRRLKAGDTNTGNTFHNTALESISNGIVLPKGHGRLIDADALLAHLEKDTREAFTKHQVWLMFSSYNEDVPTVVEADYSKEEK